ncbi:MAG: InlB B-repeat-containing protein [Clostridia bacterium]|nr:InlB B-repeat-containing protein [Clostridia bacterium]
MMIVLFAVNISAADGITVDIVSFTRGAQEDLRSSELLEARVTGYDGNVRELTYKWTSTLGTYLYVYNSHNMYGINNTDGEIEIYNSDERISSSANMSGRSYDKTFEGTGYAWAAIYGANLSNSALVGTVTVEVYDKEGKLLASDSHTGTRTKTGGGKRPTYTYSGFVVSDLEDDVSNVYFGLFEGDTKNVKILLGESSIVHITCAECSVSNPEVVTGEEIIEIVVDSDTQEAHIKSISGTSYGEATVQITVEKGNCKFHQNVSTTRTIEVYVYKKPTTTSTATAIMLDNLDEHCTYYIGGVEGVKKTLEDGKEYVVFDGLTPNTEYQIEVVGQANDKTDPVYAYVYETTKPAHVGTVEVILNGTYDTSTGVATGERVDISTVMPGVETLYLRYEDSEIYFPLTKTATGVYSTGLSDGNYTIYSAANSSAKISDQVLTISGASRTRELFFNSVTYDTDGGTPAIATEYYLVDSKVQVSDIVPVKEGYLFTHWVCQDNHEHVTGDVLSYAIGTEYKLVAQYVDSADVYVNITIKHIAEGDAGHNNEDDMHNITFTVDQRFGSDGDYTELVSKTIEWDGESAYTGTDFKAEYVNLDTEHKDRTIYTALEPTLVNVAKDAEYTFTSAKSGYELVTVTSELDDNGNWQIYAELIFKPNDFDFKFTVELDEESKKVASELKPVAVNVKVTAWGDATYDETSDILWYTISQHKDTYERIVLDENGKGSGTYPVWMADSDNVPYLYRIEVVSYETADGTILPAYDKNGEHITYATEQNRYSAEIEVENGDTPDASTLYGAYYDSETQKQVGTVNALVTIDVFDVTFVPNGGTLLDTTENTVLNYQIGIPNLDNYVPTRDGGYVFDGWYIADENGNMTDVAAVSDTIIFKDTTLIAKWKEPLTVKGEIAVDATHYEHDSLTSIVVLLQRIDANGYAETVNYLTAPITYSEDEEHGFGEYEFIGVEDNGHSYRIKTVATNYHTHYLNETSTAYVTDYDKYAKETDDDMYLAYLGDDTVANVHLHLHFMPESFDLQYEIDATAIGEGYRPTSAEVLVLCDTGEHIDPQHWAVISQMIDENGNYVGTDTALTSGVGAGSKSVWKMKAEDNTPYHYSIRVDSLTFGTEVVDYGDNLPYAIYYNGSARYSDINDAPTQTLTATIVPRMYTVTFDLGAIEDVEGITVSGMDSYLTVDGKYETAYYWSYGLTDFPKPSADGYTFLGWYNESGEKATAISADSFGNITLYAKWTVTPMFDVMADAGYYSETRDSADKEGVIAFSAKISNFDEVKDVIDAFGIYIYNTADPSVKVTVSGADMETLNADGGAYHVLFTNISEDAFDKKALAAPYVVIDGEVFIGKTMTVCVSETGKWLGAKEQN